MANILIGIQARSGSKRLPGKALKEIDDAIMTEHVIAAARSASRFLGLSHGCLVVLLVPRGDPLKSVITSVPVLEGPEDDVLSRYQLAVTKFQPEYLVRITGDCPLIKAALITKHVLSALKNRLDYVSNTFDDLRTFVDGYDCEVISKKLFHWACENVRSSFDREHVTTIIKKTPPRWAKFGVVFDDNDLSHIKLSVDTLDELTEVRRIKESLRKKRNLAEERGWLVTRF